MDKTGNTPIPLAHPLKYPLHLTCSSLLEVYLVPLGVHLCYMQTETLRCVSDASSLSNSSSSGFLVAAK